MRRLDAYNDGLGDGLVYATAIMASADNEVLNKLRDEIKAKRRALKMEGHTGSKDKEEPN